MKPLLPRVGVLLKMIIRNVTGEIHQLSQCLVCSKCVCYMNPSVIIMVLYNFSGMTAYIEYLLDVVLLIGLN